MQTAECLISKEAVNSLAVLAKKHCGDIFTEISAYQPKETTDIEKKWDAERYNRDCFLRLYELFTSNREWPFGCGVDPLAKDAIRKKMSMFKNKIKQTNQPYLALHIDFKNFPFGEVTETVGWDE